MSAADGGPAVDDEVRSFDIVYPLFPLALVFGECVVTHCAVIFASHRAQGNTTETVAGTVPFLTLNTIFPVLGCTFSCHDPGSDKINV